MLWFVTSHSPSDPGAFITAGALGALWLAGSLVARRRSPYVTRVLTEEQGIRMGRQSVPVLGLKASIVEAEVGASVAFVWDKAELFVETATLEDAQALVRLSQAELVDSFAVRVPFLLLRLVKVAVAAVGVVACLLLAAFSYHKAAFGWVVGCGLITSVLHAIESFASRRVVVGSGSGLAAARGSIKEHVLLHSRRLAVPRAPQVRMRVLARGAEPTREWLGRIDGIASDAYRGDLPPREDLRQIFDDRTSPVHERLGAARLLVRRYGVSLQEIERALEPELVPYFLEIGHDDLEHVTASIDRLGPAFRS